MTSAEHDVAIPAVVESWGEELPWEPIGPRRIRGLAEMVEVYRLFVGEGLENVEA